MCDKLDMRRNVIYFKLGTEDELGLEICGKTMIGYFIYVNSEIFINFLSLLINV